MTRSLQETSSRAILKFPGEPAPVTCKVLTTVGVPIDKIHLHVRFEKRTYRIRNAKTGGCYATIGGERVPLEFESLDAENAEEQRARLARIKEQAPENVERAARALRALRAYKSAGSDEQEGLGDLLGDLRHVCDMLGLDFETANASGRGHHACECKYPDGLGPEKSESKLRKAARLAQLDAISNQQDW